MTELFSNHVCSRMRLTLYAPYSTLCCIVCASKTFVLMMIITLLLIYQFCSVLQKISHFNFMYCYINRKCTHYSNLLNFHIWKYVTIFGIHAANLIYFPHFPLWLIYWNCNFMKLNSIFCLSQQSVTYQFISQMERLSHHLSLSDKQIGIYPIRFILIVFYRKLM